MGSRQGRVDSGASSNILGLALVQLTKAKTSCARWSHGNLSRAFDMALTLQIRILQKAFREPYLCALCAKSAAVQVPGSSRITR